MEQGEWKEWKLQCILLFWHFLFFFCIDKWICRFSYVIVACPFLLQLVDFQGVLTTWTNWFNELCCDVEYCDRMRRILSIKLPNVLPLEFLHLYFRFQIFNSIFLDEIQRIQNIKMHKLVEHLINYLMHWQNGHPSFWFVVANFLVLINCVLEVV
jgi:hypothetical protein